MPGNKRCSFYLCLLCSVAEDYLLWLLCLRLICHISQLTIQYLHGIQHLFENSVLPYPAYSRQHLQEADFLNCLCSFMKLDISHSLLKLNILQYPCRSTLGSHSFKEPRKLIGNTQFRRTASDAQRKPSQLSDPQHNVDNINHVNRKWENVFL